MPDLSWRIAGVDITPGIMNAPGLRSISFDDLADLGRSEAGAVVTASMTVHPQEGSPEPNYYEWSLGSIRSPGFPNLGYKKYGEIIPRLLGFGKPIIASITGSSLEEFMEIAGHISKREPDLIQLDLTSARQPGVTYAEKDKPEPRLTGHSMPMIERILAEVRPLVSQPLGVRLPCFIDPTNVQRVANILTQNRVDFVVSIPPINVGLVIDLEKGRSVLRSGSGLGQLAGKVIKSLGLAETKLFRHQLPGNISVVGAGGIDSGRDVFEYLLTGAWPVQVGTAFIREGPKVFSRLITELSGLLDRKGYQSAAEITERLRK